MRDNFTIMWTRKVRLSLVRAVWLLAGLFFMSGCNSMMNAWLQTNELGSFTRETTLEIRDSLSIQDTPTSVTGATDPTPEDLAPTAVEYRLAAGDAMNIFIFELLGQGAESGQQVLIGSRGRISLPVLGSLKASGLTATELEARIKEVLAERDIIYDAQVMVRPVFEGGKTYTIFGNELLGVRLNRGPGVFPIQRPDFHILEALSLSGGLSDLVDEIFIFRKRSMDRAQAAAVIEVAELEMREADAPDGMGQPLDQAPPLPGSGFTGRSSRRGGPILASARSTGRFRGRSSSSLSAQEGPSDQEGESDPPESAQEEETEEEDSAGELMDVQEIIDLMSPPPAPAEAEGDEQDKVAEEAPPPSESELEPPPSAPKGGNQLPNYIFLNGKWIEVDPSDSPETAPPAILPPPGDEPVPVVDWETIAETEEEIRIIRIPAGELRTGDLRYNIIVRPGDVIRLESGDFGFYYMTGHVRRPGVYQFRTGSTVTLKNAVAAAAGLDILGWPTRVTVYRRVGDREQMVQVNLDRIYAGLEPDFFLKKDDIVNIGTHPIAPFLFALRNLTVPQTTTVFQIFYRFARFENEFSNTNLDAPPSFPGLFP